jgi:hypothetical protein
MDWRYLHMNLVLKRTGQCGNTVHLHRKTHSLSGHRVMWSYPKTSNVGVTNDVCPSHGSIPGMQTWWHQLAKLNSHCLAAMTSALNGNKTWSRWEEGVTVRQLQFLLIMRRGYFVLWKRFISGKAVPLQAWTGLEGSRLLRFLDFKTIGTW